MNVRKQEFFHNTPEQVRGFIDDALAMTEDIDPPEDLRVAVFTQALTLLQARAINFEQVSMGMAIPRNHG